MNFRCGARFDFSSSEIKDAIIQFGAMKLLGGVPFTHQSLNNHQTLACLAQRLPIEFHSTTYFEQSQEMEQIEGHLHVCLKINAGFESMQTVSPSKPLFSEAAYWIMHDEAFDAVRASKMVLGGFAIHKGDRGELLVMLLLTLARDSAVGPPDRLGKPKQQWMSVMSFFEFLFHASPSGHATNHLSIFNAKGYVVASEEGVSSYDKAFHTQFADSKFYFNHWIKVHQFGLLNVKYLLSLYCRGAAIQCANSQHGIDGLMPFLWRGTKLSRDNLGVCMWQAKNDPSFTDQPNTSLFEAMDPFTVKIFGDDSGPDILVIRIVFVPAADRPSV
jgi:hypothetical protein